MCYTRRAFLFPIQSRGKKMSSLVLRSDHGRIAVLTLNNPPVNGYTHDMHKALDAHIIDIRMSPDIDVIVLRGNGERFFCAGADISYLRSLTPYQKNAFCLHANETLLRLENTPKLVIAAINGHCVGGGLEVAMACDLRIGKLRNDGRSDKVGLPEINLGVLPGTGGTQRLTRLLGRAKALSWMVEGKTVSVSRAVEIGLFHNALPETDWWSEVMKFATSFTRPHRSASAVGLIKRAVYGGADVPLESGLSLERELQARLFAAPDAKEGLSAYLEKRQPQFWGEAESSSVVSEAPSPEKPAEPTKKSQPQPDAQLPASSAPAASSETSGGMDLSRLRIPDEILNMVPRDLVEQYRLLPVYRKGDVLVVAMVDPSNADARAAVAEETGLSVEGVRAEERMLLARIVQYYRA